MLSLTSLRTLEPLITYKQVATLHNFLFVQVDLSAGLDVIQSKTYTSDWAFQLDMASLFNQLNDAHTLYYTPSGYQK